MKFWNDQTVSPKNYESRYCVRLKCASCRLYSCLRPDCYDDYEAFEKRGRIVHYDLESMLNEEEAS